MDVGTHALASIALTRALIPRAPVTAWIFIVAAGTIADVDALSSMFGPSAYLDWRHTFTHSIVLSAAVGLILGVIYLLIIRNATPPKLSAGALLGAALVSGFLHLGMDACGSAGIALFWPFSAHRFAADWLASVDPWVITILIAALVLPELSRLVSDEIGAKSKGPRGRVGAILGLILVIFYVGVRANFHANVVASIQARSYRGESLRRSSAYAESLSLFTWHAIVETDRTLQELTIDATPGASFDPENGTTLFKPEPSPILERAQNSEAARKFLRVASFPKASMEKTPEGYEVQIRDLRYVVSGQTRHEIVAVIQTDSNGRVTLDELRWGRDFRRR
jgi:inner membrane protein